MEKNCVEPGQDIAEGLERLCGADPRIAAGLEMANTLKPNELATEIDAALRSGEDVTVLAAAHMIQGMGRRMMNQTKN